jgi:hypothetical protein
VRDEIETNLFEISVMDGDLNSNFEKSWRAEGEKSKMLDTRLNQRSNLKVAHEAIYKYDK